MRKTYFFILVAVVLFSSFAGAMLTTLVTGKSVTASTNPGVVKASEFQLVDKNGKRKIVMALREGQPYFYLLNKKGQPSLSLNLRDGKPSIVMFNDKGHVNILLGSDKEGNPSLAFSDENQNLKCSVGIQSDHYGIELFDAAGQQTATLTTEPGKISMLHLANSSDEAEIILGLAKNRNFLLFMDENKKLRTGLLFAPDKGSFLSFYDPDGKARYTSNLHPTTGATLAMKNNSSDYALRLNAKPTGAMIMVSHNEKDKYVSGGLGILDKLPWMVLQHPSGGRVDAIFSKFGQPYMKLVDKNKKIWSAPGNMPPATKDLILPRQPD